MKGRSDMKSKLPPGFSALLEVGVMFLPAIPAYLWLWPNVEGTSVWIANSLSDLYAIAGSLFIGLRRWSLDELGVNIKGLWLGLACGLAIVTGTVSRHLICRLEPASASTQPAASCWRIRFRLRPGWCRPGAFIPWAHLPGL